MTKTYATDTDWDRMPNVGLEKWPDYDTDAVAWAEHVVIGAVSLGARAANDSPHSEGAVILRLRAWASPQRRG